MRLSELYVEITGRDGGLTGTLRHAKSEVDAFNRSAKAVVPVAARDERGRFTGGVGRRGDPGGAGTLGGDGRWRDERGRFLGGGLPGGGGGAGGGMFSGILGGLTQTLAQARAKLMGFAGEVGSIRINLGAMFYGLAGAGAALGYVVKKAVDLESALAQIRKTSGLSADELVQLRVKLETLANTMAGVSLSDVLGVAAMAGSLGVQGVEGIAEFTKAISMIKIALDDVPAEKAATDIARILNVFHLGTDSAMAFGSALNKLADVTTATGGDILDVTRRISGHASVLGVSPQKVMALAAALKDAGVENEVAGTAIDGIFMKMAGDVEGFAAIAGVSAKEFGDAMKGDALEGLKLLIAGLKKMENTEQVKALNGLKLDGARASGALMQLESTIGRVAGYTKTANDEWKTQASIFSEVAIQGGTAKAQLTLLGNQASLAAASVGENFLPVLKQLTGEFGLMAAAARDGSGTIGATLRPAIDAVSSSITTVGVVFRNVADVLELAQLDMAIHLEDWRLAFVDVFVDIGLKAMGMADVIRMAMDEMGNAMRGAMPDLAAVGAAFDRAVHAKAPAADRGGIKALEDMRTEVQDRIAKRETEHLDERDKVKNARPAAVVPAEAKKEPAGTGKAPEEEEKAKKTNLFSDPAAFAKSIQEGMFGKDKDKIAIEQLGVQKQTMEQVKEMVLAFKQRHRVPGLISE